MLRHALLASFLLASVTFAKDPRARISEANEDNQMPGWVQFTDIHSQDRVELDGSTLRGSALERMSYKVMLAPGEYPMRITSTDASKSCTLLLVVREDQMTQASCAAHK